MCIFANIRWKAKQTKLKSNIYINILLRVKKKLAKLKNFTALKSNKKKLQASVFVYIAIYCIYALLVVYKRPGAYKKYYQVSAAPYVQAIYVEDLRKQLILFGFSLRTWWHACKMNK